MIMLKEKVEKTLNHQIELEQFSSQLYMAMASWAETNGYNVFYFNKKLIS